MTQWYCCTLLRSVLFLAFDRCRVIPWTSASLCWTGLLSLSVLQTEALRRSYNGEPERVSLGRWRVIISVCASRGSALEWVVISIWAARSAKSDYTCNGCHAYLTLNGPTVGSDSHSKPINQSTFMPGHSKKAYFTTIIFKNKNLW